jgi:hypothetical protein
MNVLNLLATLLLLRLGAGSHSTQLQFLRGKKELGIIDGAGRLAEMQESKPKVIQGEIRCNDNPFALTPSTNKIAAELPSCVMIQQYVCDISHRTVSLWTNTKAFDEVAFHTCRCTQLSTLWPQGLLSQGPVRRVNRGDEGEESNRGRSEGKGRGTCYQ